MSTDPEPPSGVIPPRWLRWAVALAVLVHTVLCVAHLRYLQSSPLLDYLPTDLERYDSWAREIASGAWLGTGVFYQDPLYPYLMAAIYALTGANIVHVLVVQIACSAGTVLLVYRLGARLWDWRVGLVAAWGLALYRPAIFYACKPEKACLSAFGLALATWWLVQASSGRQSNVRFAGALRWWRCGAALAVVALMRANVLLPALGVVALVASTRWLPTRRRRLLAVAAMLAGLATVLLPVLVRNRIVSGDWVLTTSQAGANLFIGNNPQNANGSYTALPFVRPSPDFEQQDFHRHAEQALGRRLSPSEASAYYEHEVLAWALHDPAAFLRLQMTKVRVFLNWYEIPDNWSLYFVRRYSSVLRLPLAGFGLILPLAILGLGLALRKGSAWPRRALAWLAMFYAASVVAFFIYSRYRYPIVFVLILLAASAAIWLGEQARAHRFRRLTAGLLVVGAATAAALLPPAIDPKADLSHRYYNLAATLYQRDYNDEAAKLCREALAIHPRNYRALFALSQIAAEEGDKEAERIYLERAFQINPEDDAIVAARTASMLRDLPGEAEPSSTPPARSREK